MASHFFAQMLIICVFCLSTYCAAARPTFFFAASAASCTRVFFACLSTLGREETEKESLVTFFSVSLLSSWASKHLFVKPSVAQFWLFVRLHVLPPHSQSNCAFVEASQGSRELDYSVIQLYFHWSCDVLWIEGALDVSKTGAVLTAPLLLAEIFWTALLLRILGNMPENRVFFVQFFFIFLGF